MKMLLLEKAYLQYKDGKLSHFDKLFALVFNNRKIQKQTIQSDYLNMLINIAISLQLNI